jgi:hypothetical protein
VRGRHAPWDFTILNALQAEGGGAANLAEIYRFIEWQQQANKAKGLDEYLPSSDFEPTRWGGRPMYQHTARSVITNRRNGLIRHGLVERVARGRYRLTDAGRKQLQEWDS